jgi:hypothetical protein
MLSASSRSHGEFIEEAEALGLPLGPVANDFFADGPTGTVFVVNCSLDAAAWYRRYYHRDKGWHLIFEPHGSWDVNLVEDTDDVIMEKISSAVQPSQVPHLLKAASHLRNHYYVGYREQGHPFESDLHEVIERVPFGSKLIFLTNDQRSRRQDGTVDSNPNITELHASIASVVADLSYAGVISFSSAIEDESEIQIGGNHYDRLVYWRMANSIVDMIRTLDGKG